MAILTVRLSRLICCRTVAAEDVGPICDGLKMLWIYAISIPTAAIKNVIDNEPFRDWAPVKIIAQSVSAPFNAVEFYFAVPIWLDPPLKPPATCVRINFRPRPKARCQSHRICDQDARHAGRKKEIGHGGRWRFYCHLSGPGRRCCARCSNTASKCRNSSCRPSEQGRRRLAASSPAPSGRRR